MEVVVVYQMVVALVVSANDVSAEKLNIAEEVVVGKNEQQVLITSWQEAKQVVYDIVEQIDEDSETLAVQIEVPQINVIETFSLETEEA